jgi:hypothetical protein
MRDDNYAYHKLFLYGLEPKPRFPLILKGEVLQLPSPLFNRSLPPPKGVLGGRIAKSIFNPIKGSGYSFLPQLIILGPGCIIR